MLLRQQHMLLLLRQQHMLLLLRQTTTPCTLHLLTAAQAELRLHAGVQPADCQ